MMKAYFSLAEINSLKADLGHILSHVKSSHRVEAMARGLGWRTYASLRADLVTSSMERTIDDGRLIAYLQEHGFSDLSSDALSEATVRCKTRPLIQAVLDREPALGPFGYGHANEGQLLQPNCIHEFIKACGFLTYFPRTRTINRRVNSYTLKHWAEELYKKRNRDHVPDPFRKQDYYISNGAFIAAAIHLGFTTERMDANAYFNIGRRHDRPLPYPDLLGTNAYLPRYASGRTTLRFRAWQNTLVAAINEGLLNKSFLLHCHDDERFGTKAYEFTIADLPAIALVTEMETCDLHFRIAVNPRGNIVQKLLTDTPGRSEGDAFVAGTLQRPQGIWLETSLKPTASFRRSLIPTLAAAYNHPTGYELSGEFLV